MTDSVSIIVPARSEGKTLGATLPRMLRAADTLPAHVELVLVVPSHEAADAEPYATDARVRLVQTHRPGKSVALSAGVQSSTGSVIVFIDADVAIEEHCLTDLLEPILAGTHDVVAGRIEFVRRAANRRQRVLERWADVSAEAWDALRQNHPECLWALPGALYATRRSFVGSELIVPLVDDASFGLHARAAGARFAYVPTACARVLAPSSYPRWVRQKLRTRRGWLILRELRPVEVVHLEKTLQVHFESASRQLSGAWVMRLQDALLRLVARYRLSDHHAATAWRPIRSRDHHVALEEAQTDRRPK